jgi:predicted PurR-regulated permease PerM
MTAKKKTPAPDHGFTSLKIISERAHRLFERARSLQRKREEEEVPEDDPEETPVYPHVVVHLSLWSVVRGALAALAIVTAVGLLYLLIDKLVLLVLAMFVAIVVDPGVQKLKSWGIARGFGILIHYFIAVFLLIFLLVSLIPVLAEQIQQIAVFTNDRVNAFLASPHIALPFLGADVNERLTIFVQYMIQSLSITHVTDAMQQMGQDMATTAQGSLLLAAQLAGSVLGFFLNLTVILVLGFFMQLEKRRIIGWLRGFLPWSYRSYVDDKSEAIQWKLAEWARGQVLLCLSVCVLVFLALTIVRMPYALTLGILAGFTEFIPVIGPLLAAIPAVLIAGTQEGFFWAVVIAAVYYVIQWCENNLLVPLIMKRAVNLSPIAILFSMLVGISFPGVIHPVVGIILAIPVTTVISLFLEDWHAYRIRRTLRQPSPAKA